MVGLVFDSAAAEIGLESRYRRVATRPPALRQPDFYEKFDDRTICYSAIVARGGGTVLLIAPPFRNLLPLLKGSVFKALPSQEPCSWSFKDLDRQTQIKVRVPVGTRELLIAGELGTFLIQPESEALDLFAGQRVLLTKSKNNRIEWITDWIKYHRDIHQATAVLIYDNGSTIYNAEELTEAISKIHGIAKAIVVRWPFRFGPTGVGKRKYWDSDFSQYAILEDARWRFLQQAASVLYLDVDELVQSPTGQSIFSRAETSRSGIVSFLGDWVYGFDGKTPKLSAGHIPRFRDYSFVQRATSQRNPLHLLRRDPVRCMAKWSLVPARCPLSAQWHTHHIKGWFWSRIIDQRFAFRHFREISLGWKYDRSARDEFDVDKVYEDEVMARDFAVVDW